MGRMTFVLRRLLQLVPVAIGVTIIVFFMIHLIPGDPARTILGIHATPRSIAILHREWGLNRPLLSQYWLFMDRLVHGDLGQSLFYGVPAAGVILDVRSGEIVALVSLPDYDPNNPREARDKERFNRFFHSMLDAGVYLAPSAFEAGFVSSAHGTADIEETIRVAGDAFRRLA